MTFPDLAAINLKLDTATLVQETDGRFRPEGRLPEWFAGFGCDVASDQPIRLEDYLLFFDTFLLEVRDQLSRNVDTVQSSGPWSETDRNGVVRNLSAIVLMVEGRLVVQIKLIPLKHQYQQAIFQQARNYSLKFEQLAREREHKEILLHTIIHDLAGPLTSIHGVLELMRRGRTTPELTSIAVEQCQVQKKMISSILDTFVSLSPDKSMPGSRSEAPDIIFSAQQAVAKFEPAYQNKRVNLKFNLATSETMIRVVSEADLLERVFSNLLENALRHSSENTTTELRMDASKDGITVSVIDEGTGIPVDKIESLFNRYTSSGENAGNVGLGLYFCKIVIERWGGKLRCDNRTDVTGSIFQFELPRYDTSTSQS